MRARDGHWVGFDPESDGHRIYFPDRGNIGIERSVAFKQCDASAPPRTTASALIEGEQVPRVVPEVPEREEVDQHAEPFVKFARTTNLAQRQTQCLVQNTCVLN